MNRGFPALWGRGAPSRPEFVRDRDEAEAGRWSVLRGFSRLTQRPPAVGQQLLDPTRRVGADPVEHVAEVRLRVDPQGLARRAQAHQHGGRLAPAIAPRKQPVFTPKRDWLKCAFTSPVVELEEPPIQGTLQ